MDSATVGQRFTSSNKTVVGTGRFKTEDKALQTICRLPNMHG